MNEKITNGAIWKDIDGNVISCHGGGFLKKGDYFYWFGENRNDDKLISCYRSKDLVNWEFRHDVVTKATHGDLDPSNCERPKVIYNAKTGKYVMWLHWENGINYAEARCAVFICDTIDGDYTYQRSFRPLGHMSRDCTLFQDDDQTAYFISAANHNFDLHIYRLTDDYLDIACLEKKLWIGESREAPAVFKKGEYYFMITSGCSGWHPNQAKYAYSHSITGEWSDLFHLGSPTTFDTQPTYVLPINGKGQTTYLYVGDRWDPCAYHNSSYVFLPLEFSSKTSINLEWASEISVDLGTGKVKAQVNENHLYRITSFLKYLLPLNESTEAATPIAFSRLTYPNEYQLWEIEYADGNYFRIKHHLSGKYLAPKNFSNKIETKIVLVNENDHDSLQWRKTDIGEGYVYIQNKYNQLVLSFAEDADKLLVQRSLNWQESDYRHEQAILLAKVYD